MPRELTACEIDSIMVGATFLGAGGGGPLDTRRPKPEKKNCFAVVHWIPAANC